MAKRCYLSLVISVVLPLAAAAQTGQKPYEPVVGQVGKDAVWVPTGPAMVERMLDHAKVTPQDFVIDLGSGDGRTVIAAAKRGARGLGVEYNADLVEYSRKQAAAAGVGDKASFAQGDMYAADISRATVLALFLLPSNIEKLVPKFLELPAGTRIVANTFWAPDWTPDDTQTMTEGCENWCTSHLFIIPAKVAGQWRVGDGVVELTQKYQMVEGTYTPATGAPTPVKGRVRGKVITVSLGPDEYEGTVNGNTMEGAAKSGNREKIVATRIQ
jgi:hypothetical protein